MRRWCRNKLVMRRHGALLYWTLFIKWKAALSELTALLSLCCRNLVSHQSDSWFGPHVVIMQKVFSLKLFRSDNILIIIFLAASLNYQNEWCDPASFHITWSTQTHEVNLWIFSTQTSELKHLLCCFLPADVTISNVFPQTGLTGLMQWTLNWWCERFLSVDDHQTELRSAPLCVHTDCLWSWGHYFRSIKRENNSMSHFIVPADIRVENIISWKKQKTWLSSENSLLWMLQQQLQQQHVSGQFIRDVTINQSIWINTSDTAHVQPNIQTVNSTLIFIFVSVFMKI